MPGGDLLSIRKVQLPLSGKVKLPKSTEHEDDLQDTAAGSKNYKGRKAGELYACQAHEQGE
jgi:hypothetical protein